jgi:hypothetical protein
VRFAHHHYTTFSHHNSFWPLDPENTTTATSSMYNKSINQWMVTPLNMSVVDAHRLPMSPSYRAAVAATGDAATIYDYIRDHLGYRLEFSAPPSASLVGGDGDGGSGTAPRQLLVQGSVSNFGFSAPVNPRPVLLTLQRAAGANATVVWSVAVGSDDSAGAAAAPDPRTWQPHAPADPRRATLNHSLDTRVALPPAEELPPGVYLVGVALPDARVGFAGPGCCVRFANLADSSGAGAAPGGDGAAAGAPYWHAGVNVIGRITVG